MLRHRERLAGERGLVDFAPDGLKDATVSGDHVARLQLEHVAAHKPAPLHGLNTTTSADVDACRHGLQQLADRRVSADSLRAAYQGICSSDTGDEPGVCDRPDRGGEPGTHGQHRGERVRQFDGHGAEERRARWAFCRQLRVATRRFGGREPPTRRAERTEHGVRRHGVPCDLRDRRWRGTSAQR
jgi:hypothetical protein